MEINVLIEDGVETELDADWLRGVAEQVLVGENVGPDIELGLVVASQETVHELNRRYRQRDEPTDVLAFATMEEAGADSPPFVTPPDGIRHLGEVIVSYQQAILQAQEQQHPVKREMAILIIHGVLHLLGYDHEAPEDEQQMRARETAVLSAIKL